MSSVWELRGGISIFTRLLIVIYFSFISLGLPDSLLGSAWPTMRADLAVPVSYAGIVSMVISFGTVFSSLMSARMIRRLGTGVVTAVSVGMTAAALIGYSFSDSFLPLCILSVPLGLGAGSVDAALNNFVALHYEARHMNWLHCFWGVGATAGPVVMSLCLARNGGWQAGYGIIGMVQCALFLVLIFSLPLWKRAASTEETRENGEKIAALPLKALLRIPNSGVVLLSFFCYCALETTTGLWGGSYAAERYRVSSGTAAFWTSLYYLGITAGRLVSGFVSIRLGNRQLIRAGQGCALAGILLLLLPLPVWKLPAGLCLIGMGCAPIYPGMLHETPNTFGSGASQAMMGVQMAVAYIGSTFMPPLFGFIAGRAGIFLFPAYLLVLTAVMAVCTEKTGIRMKKKTAAAEDVE